MKNIFKDLFKKKVDTDESTAPISTTPSNDPKKNLLLLIKLNQNLNL